MNSRSLPSRFRFYDLEGKTLLMTGTTRGLGKAQLPELLAQGLKLILVSKGLEQMETIRKELGADNDTMRLYDCDLADAKAVEAVALAILETGCPIDGILNNAGIDPRDHFSRGDDAFWQQVFQVNLFAAVSLTRHLLPQLKQSTQGRILFTSSILSDLGGACLTAYVSSKGALEALTRALAHELKGTGITVNCLVPGAILVEKETETPDSRQRIINWQSVSRRLQPHDLTGLVCLLLSQAGSGLSGQCLTIDGGVLHPLASPEVQGAGLPE